MKQSTANGIRTFLINIQKHCVKNGCHTCPYSVYAADMELMCLLSYPEEWCVEDILARYERMMHGETY